MVELINNTSKTPGISRQVVLDTETTGIGHEHGHRIIEVACVELVDRKLTGKTYQTYLNPQRTVDEGAFRVHGISTDFLKDKPLFQEIAHELFAFIDGAQLVIHNAPFDVGFLNAELKRIQWDRLLEEQCTVLDTLVLAREKHPGARNNLDALCKRYNITHFNRQLHGALLDAQILALVYLAMTGGQGNLFAEPEPNRSPTMNQVPQFTPLDLKNPVVIKATPQERHAHEEYISWLNKEHDVEKI